MLFSNLDWITNDSCFIVVIVLSIDLVYFNNFIIKNEDKEFYSCNPDVFNKKYEVCKVEE